MLLTISTTQSPATDLGYLLAKHPGRAQRFSLSFGAAHVVYPVAQDDRCTAALILDLDPIELVRGRQSDSGSEGLLDQYVNDRPYVASSLLCTAISRVFGGAMNGVSRDRPELAATAIPLEAHLPVLPCRGGEPFLRGLFEPLGYDVVAERLPLDERFPEWGNSVYFAVTLRRVCRLSELLTQLYVLLPVLDDDKHYWVGVDELEKLLAKGAGWLDGHPARDRIVERYLKRDKRLVRQAISRLEAEEAPDAPALEVASEEDEHRLESQLAAAAHGEKPKRLNDLRTEALVAEVRQRRARSVIDVGCGDGKLLAALLKERTIERLAGTDVSWRSLDVAARRLRLDTLSESQRERVSLFQSSLTYRDARFAGFDLACAVEVVEHLDAERLPAFEHVLFAEARPGTVLLTTPNREYNALFEGLPEGRMRHKDHRFEWSRAEFEAWARGVADRHGYSVTFAGIGAADPELGAPTQMAVFTIGGAS
jgi:3' terminal RNA ribose 2'-O-methyltransferase Hen1